MGEKLYEQFVDLLREKHPELTLDKVITDIEAAVESFGIKVKYSDMLHIKTSEEISGYARVVNGRPEIVVNALQNFPRQRFTIAHELGHILLHWEWFPGKVLPEDLVEISYRKEIYLTTDERIREIQANNFAAEFLAPLQAVVEFLLNIDKTDKEVQITEISNKFKISNLAASYRWEKAQGVLNESFG